MVKSQIQDVVDYLASKHDVWTAGTVKAATSRLMQYNPSQTPAQLYSKMKLENYKPYYIKISFITISAFADWQVAQGRANINPYKLFLQQNNQLFRNAYEDKYATITWAEFLEEYNNASQDMRIVLALLGFGGCRLGEVKTFDGITTLGKGGKRRPIHLPSNIAFVPVCLSTTQIRRRLRHNPHSYRKLAADTWARNGIDLKTIQVLLGHSSLASTQRYLRPMQQDELKLKLEDAWRTA